METNPIKNPTPERDSRIINLAAADKPRPKGQRVEFDENMQKAFGLLNAKVQLEQEIEELVNRKAHTPEGEGREALKKSITELEENKRDVLDTLAKLRPEEFANEAAFEKALASEKPKRIREAEKVKNDLEEKVDKLRGKLRLLSAEYSEAVGKNLTRAHELEAEMTPLQTEFLKADRERLAAWEQLATLDKKRFGEQAQFEKTVAKSSEAKKTTGLDEDEEDILKNLRADIGK